MIKYYRNILLHGHIKKRQRFIVPVSPKLLEAGGTLFKTSRKEVHIVSVDTFVSIVDTMLQAVAVGLMIMTVIYGNKKK